MRLRSLFWTCAALGLLFPASAASRADDSPIAGRWRFTLPVQRQALTMLVMFSQSDGKWFGDFLGSSMPFRQEPTITDLSVNNDQVRFSLRLGSESMPFDGVYSKEANRIRGSIRFGNQLLLLELFPTQLKKLDDPVAVNLELIQTMEVSQELFEATFEVLRTVTPKQAKVEQVRAIVERVTKAAEAYGPRWQRETATRLADALAGQPAYAAIALDQARRAERLLSAREEPATQIQTLETIAAVFRKAGKPEEAQEFSGRIAKLEVRDYQEYLRKSPLAKVEAYPGRKGKSERTTLVELFTNAECGPCVAADLAFDALERIYKPTEVILLQYHGHRPGPDPLANPDSLARFESYGNKITGTPTIFFNGKPDDSGGGSLNLAKVKLQTYREAIDETLEQPLAVRLQLTATRNGADIEAKAVVSELAKPGEKVMLRFALVEPRVRYRGGNGIRYHHCVVRAFLGGVKGFVLTQAKAEQTVRINLDELRKRWNQHLDSVATQAEEPFSARPMDFKSLRVVAFVQDDATGEVLHAVQVDLDPQKPE